MPNGKNTVGNGGGNAVKSREYRTLKQPSGESEFDLKDTYHYYPIST